MNSKITSPCTCVALLSACVVMPFVSPAQAAETSQRPNIILIMADDMGYSDIQPYGGEIATPVLNRLAEHGLRYTQFYNTSRCCPTRASLLTGLYPHQAGVGWMMTDRGTEGYAGELNQKCVTIAEALKPAGYATFMTGKWHVTPHVLPGESQANWPCQRGFDRFYGTIHGAGSFFDPNSLTRDNTLISPFSDPEYKPETYYYTDAISDHAVRFIDEHVNHPRAEQIAPFFLYVAYTAAHWPMHALPEDIAKYKGRYDEGYGAIRQERKKRMEQLGLIDPQWKLTEQAEDWEAVEHRDWELRCMEVYAAMVDRMDQGIGKIVKQLEATDQLDNTLIFFLQDNGGCAEPLGRRVGNNKSGTRADGPTLAPMAATDLQLDMIPKQSRDGFPVLQGPGVLPGPADTYIAYGRGWANVSNTPFREYKHWVHEGGISTPLIVHWPQGVKRSGDFESTPSHLIDIMATCVDVAGATYPSEKDGTAIRPLEGQSLVPTFHGDQIEREALYWEHEGNRAIREGDWKLVAKENQPWELYNMVEDRTETRNLAAEMPDKVKAIAAKWDAYAARCNVLPLGGWRGVQKQGDFSNKQRFELAAGETLNQQSAPHVVNKPFTVQVTLDKFARDGVLVAQGGSSLGWALSMKEGQVEFAIRNQGKLLVVPSEQPLTAASSIEAIVRKSGQVVLKVDGKQVGSGTIPALLAKMPVDGLEVGQDARGLVGTYGAENAYAGTIKSVVISIGGGRR